MKHALLYQCRYLSICLKIFMLPYRQHSGTLFSQLVRIMKITGIIILAACLHVSAALYSQKVTLKEQNSKLSDVFVRLRQQTGYNFIYNNKLLKKAVPVTVNAADEQLEEVLGSIFKNQPLSFSIIEKTIVVKEKEKTVLSEITNYVKNAMESVIPDGPVRGIVTDERGDPLPGVTITLTIPGAQARSVASNADGKYSFSAVPSGAVLLFNMIGFKRQEIAVANKEVINVKLQPDVKELQNVVITGYQEIKKDNYTGNAIVIKGDDLKKTNPQNVLKAIQSFDPSFKLLENNLAGSDPNAMPRINVRGATALPAIPTNADDLVNRENLSAQFNLPAFILDGFEVSVQKVVDLDINRIESVTLLKDAAATAVYGSRAANGVMVITTKAPVSGKLQLYYNSELQVTAPDLSGYDILNAADKVAYEQKAGLFSTQTAGVGDNTQDKLDAELFIRLKNVASGVNTYWLSQPLRNAYGQKHSLNVQGGDQTFRYGVDLRYQTMPGVMKGATRDRFSGGMNFTYNPSPKLLIRNDLSVNQTNGVNSNYGSFSTYASMNPYYPIRDSVGRIVQELANWRVDTYREGSDQYINRYVFNPLHEASLSNFSKESYFEMIDALSADYKISGSLRLRALISLNNTISKSDKFLSPFSKEFYDYSTNDLNKRGSYDYSNTNRLGIDGTISLSYNKQINDHFFNLVAGTNVLSAKSDFKSFSAQGFSNDRFTNVGFARIYKENSSPDGDVLIQRTLGAFFSGNYSYKNKYLMDASFRLDGSSAFGADSRFAPFWALGLGWNIHNENFLKDNAFISQVRLKASTGILGSIGFPAYMSRSIYTYYSNNWYSTGIGAATSNYGNTNLEWQKTETYDVGLDIGFLKDRFVISPRYYYKLTKGLITDINLAPSTGFTTYKENLGDMSNKGYEVYLKANLFTRNDAYINITGNIAHNENTIVKISNSLKAFNKQIDDIQKDEKNKLYAMPLLRYNEGQSLNTIYGVKSLGIDPENGKEIFVKTDGSLTYEYDVRDTRPIGNSTPVVEGNIGSSIGYKRFTLSFNFWYRLGADIYNQTLVDRIENADPRFNVDRRAMTLRWSEPGDAALYKNIQDLTPTKASSRFIQRESLIDLQSVYLSYDFKRDLVRRIGFQNIRASVSMNDLFRSSSIKIERGINSPYARSATFSLLAAF
ncbi:SusC/RagA family TonB-linked outer membrane protein [Arcticibacter tournemirensis]|nr:SusC/RagA family TonB-linked outer membrane protein [Arcticibacter tournemirensis]